MLPYELHYGNSKMGSIENIESYKRVQELFCVSVFQDKTEYNVLILNVANECKHYQNFQ